MAEVFWTSGAKNELQELDPPVQKRLIKKISWLAENFEHITPDPLSADLQDFYKLRVGDYRVIYDVPESEKLEIRMVGHRKDIYE